MRETREHNIHNTRNSNSQKKTVLQKNMDDMFRMEVMSYTMESSDFLIDYNTALSNDKNRFQSRIASLKEKPKKLSGIEKKQLTFFVMKLAEACRKQDAITVIIMTRGLNADCSEDSSEMTGRGGDHNGNVEIDVVLEKDIDFELSPKIQEKTDVFTEAPGKTEEFELVNQPKRREWLKSEGEGGYTGEEAANNNFKKGFAKIMTQNKLVRKFSTKSITRKLSKKMSTKSSKKSVSLSEKQENIVSNQNTSNQNTSNPNTSNLTDCSSRRRIISAVNRPSPFNEKMKTGASNKIMLNSSSPSPPAISIKRRVTQPRAESVPVIKPAYKTHRKTASGNLMNRIKFFEETEQQVDKQCWCVWYLCIVFCV